jgi:hypothetical protein
LPRPLLPPVTMMTLPDKSGMSKSGWKTMMAAVRSLQNRM